MKMWTWLKEVLGVKHLQSRPPKRLSQVPVCQARSRVAGVREHAAMHQVYPHTGDYVRYVYQTEQKRFATRQLNLEHTGELPRMPPPRQAQ